MTETFSELCLGDLQAVIRDFERNQERSLQVEVGPSELGTPCSRQLVMKLLGADTVNTEQDMWPATVGTAIHQLLADAFRRNNTVLASAGRPARWLVEQPVTIRPGLTGHTDLIDLWTWTVIDHKNVSVKSLRDHKKAGHPGQQYEIQAHLYGLGWARAGLPIETVAIAFYPKSGMMRDSWLWTHPYDESIAVAALDRMDTLLADANEADLAGQLDQWLWALPRDTTHCMWCPVYEAGREVPSETPAATCSGPFEDPLYKGTGRPKIPGLVS
jgi:hypothetical protein